MKKVFTVAAIAVSGILGYYMGQKSCTKDLEAACFFKDIINSAMDYDDTFGHEMINLYEEWTQDFEELEFTSLKEEDLDKYYWCY